MSGNITTQITDATSGIILKSLLGLPFDILYSAHLNAFKDYPFQWSKQSLEKTIHRRGYDPSLSFGAFHNDELVSFTWNGIGMYKGLLTAYDTGTGTCEGYRKQGLASAIFEYSVPFLKQAGVQQYILEVLEENKAAVSVYTKQGFEVSRTFDCFRINSGEWIIPQHESSENIYLKEVDISAESAMLQMHDFELSWQNNFQALKKNPGDFIIIGAFEKNNLIGYGIIEPASGDIPQLAVTKPYRRKGIGSVILHALKELNKADIIKIVNIESDQDHIISFINKNGIPKIVSQFEMIKLL